MQHPGPDEDGVSRIIPKSIFEGEHGAFLKELGFSPDDASNMMPTQESVQAKHDEYFAEQTRFVDKINSQLPPGTSVAPYAMLPWDVWKGEFGQMLMVTCEYYPTQPWNTMLLAEDQRSSFVLDIPEHPGCYPPNLVPSAEKHLAEFRDQLDAARTYTDRSMAAGEMDMKVFDAAVEKVKSHVLAMANTFASISLGEDVYDRHLELFGRTLGWPHADALLAKQGK